MNERKRLYFSLNSIKDKNLSKLSPVFSKTLISKLGIFLIDVHYSNDMVHNGIILTTKIPVKRFFYITTKTPVVTSHT